jgi:transposase
MARSYSRHKYLALIFDQQIGTWIGCHRRAFAWFEGVPKELVFDNLRAAVLRASLEDPLLCEPCRQLARHYSCLLHPCRPHTPEHKGNAESGVHYVPRDLLAAEQPAGLAQASQRAPHWVRDANGDLGMHRSSRRESVPPAAGPAVLSALR